MRCTMLTSRLHSEMYPRSLRRVISTVERVRRRVINDKKKEKKKKITPPSGKKNKFACMGGWREVYGSVRPVGEKKRGERINANVSGKEKR